VERIIPSLGPIDQKVTSNEWRNDVSSLLLKSSEAVESHTLQDTSCGSLTISGKRVLNDASLLLGAYKLFGRWLVMKLVQPLSTSSFWCIDWKVFRYRKNSWLNFIEQGKLEKTDDVWWLYRIGFAYRKHPMGRDNYIEESRVSAWSQLLRCKQVRQFLRISWE